MSQETTQEKLSKNISTKRFLFLIAYIITSLARYEYVASEFNYAALVISLYGLGLFSKHYQLGTYLVEKHEMTRRKFSWSMGLDMTFYVLLIVLITTSLIFN